MKLSRVTGRGIFAVACLMLACLGFILSGITQYREAAQVCKSLSATLQGHSCVSTMGDGSTFALDKSSEISDAHIGGLVLIVVGLLGFTFGLVTSFKMYNFLADAKDARLVEEEMASLEQQGR